MNNIPHISSKPYVKLTKSAIGCYNIKVAMKKKNKRKKVLIISAILLLVVVAIVVYGFVIKPKQVANTSTSSPEAIMQADQQSVASARSEGNKNPNEQPSQTQSMGVYISSVGQAEGKVSINALVSGNTSGNCKLTLTNGSQKIVKSAPIGLQISYYICQGFSINSSEFSPKGEWIAVVEATGPGGSGTSEPRKVTVQ